MPVTAKLSKAFHEKVGEQATNELVDWFNAVDATYRTDLREFNELNFARFDAKVEQRFAQQDAKIEQRFAVQDVKLAEFRASVEAKFEQLGAEMRAGFVAQDAKLERRIGEHLRFMYLAWAAQMAAIVGFGTATLSLIR